MIRTADGEFRTEADFTSAALRAVCSIPLVMAWRVNSGRRGGISFGGIRGAPDLQGIVGNNGQFWACELKMPKGMVSPDQESWMALAAKRGALVWVARTLDEVVTPLLRELREGDDRRSADAREMPHQLLLYRVKHPC